MTHICLSMVLICISFCHTRNALSAQGTNVAAPRTIYNADQASEMANMNIINSINKEVD